MGDFDRAAMLEMFVFEMFQLIDQLEATIVQSETEYNTGQINEIFRIMHTIKGSSAMMLYNNITNVSHVIEDLFYYLREENPSNVDYKTLSDLVLSGADFIKEELNKLQNGEELDGESEYLTTAIQQFLASLKDSEPVSPPPAATPSSNSNDAIVSNGDTYYSAHVFFQDGCEMENVRAFTLIHNLKDFAENIKHTPEDVIDESSLHIIRESGFFIEFSSVHDYAKMHAHLSQTIYLRELVLTEQTAVQTTAQDTVENVINPTPIVASTTTSESPHLPLLDELLFIASEVESTGIEPEQAKVVSADETQQRRGVQTSQSMINVRVSKLDNLLNIMSELVMSETMVTKNPDLAGLQLENFEREASSLQKVISNLRHSVMSLRMVPVSATFFRMNRIVRDMCRQLGKEVELVVVGEEIEVDKNIIEQIADPIMHIIRNSIDHGIETAEERQLCDKPLVATVHLEARNSGGDVLIVIRDDGRGIDTGKVLSRAREHGLLSKPDHEYSDKEIYQFIFLPGFSTNDQVTEFSGRGVGMDVVSTHLAQVGGSVIVDSTPGEGTVFTLKIPTSLAIIECMSVSVAGFQYTIPITNIITSFRAKPDSVFFDPSGNEMVTERSEIYNIVRLHEFFGIDDAITNIDEGILIMLENDDKYVCLLADKLLGQQQVVLKPMPSYLQKVRGIGGCTLLGNGDISLIVDVPGFFD